MEMLILAGGVFLGRGFLNERERKCETQTEQASLP